MMNMKSEVVVIVADGEVDSVHDWGAEATQHVTDLRLMGCTVRVKLFRDDVGTGATPWERAQAYADGLQGGEV